MRSVPRPIAARALGSALAMLIAAFGMAQGKFIINGKLKVEGGSVEGCRMVVYRGGEKFRTISDGLNKFSMELELNTDYILSFEKNGFVTKRLSFDTHAPATAGQKGLTPFEFVISLFKQYEGMNTVVFNQPVGRIRYDQVLADFDYDTDYTKSIQSALEEAQAEVVKKQQNEEREEADKAKRKEQDDKEKAKADARAAKDAEAKAKVEAQAKAQKEAEEREAEKARTAQSTPAPPMPAPPPAVAKEEPKRPEPRPITAPGTIAKPAQGSDTRMASTARLVEEKPRVEPAVARTAVEVRPKFESAGISTVRHQDVIVEPNQVVTVVRLERGDESTEYRKVVRKYSGIFYFKDGRSCSQIVYENEAMAEVR